MHASVCMNCDAVFSVSSYFRLYCFLLSLSLLLCVCLRFAAAIQIKVMMGNQKADTKQLEVAGKVGVLRWPCPVRCQIQLYFGN